MKAAFTLIKSLIARHPKSGFAGRRKAILPGFTLIELLIVISIIGILAAFAFVSFSSAQARARDAERKNDLNQLQKALQLYYNDNQRFPIANCLSSPWWNCWQHGVAGSILGPSGSSYIKQMPQDPKFYDDGAACAVGNTGTRAYAYYSMDGNSYILATRLENLSDSSINFTGNGGGCTGFGNYKVENP